MFCNFPVLISFIVRESGGKREHFLNILNMKMKTSVFLCCSIWESRSKNSLWKFVNVIWWNWVFYFSNFFKFPTTTIDIKVSEMGHFKFNSTTSILELKFLWLLYVPLSSSHKSKVNVKVLFDKVYTSLCLLFRVRAALRYRKTEGWQPTAILHLFHYIVLSW